MAFGWFEIFSLLINVVLGGGLIATLVTLRATKKEAYAKAQKAVAEARTTELVNIESAIKIWRQIAQEVAEKHDSVSEQVEILRKEIRRLNNINNKILKLLDRITPENVECMVEAIKNEINETR